MDILETVPQFFDRYARALSEIDLDTLADCYAYPALAVSRLGRQAIPDAEATRAFFDANGRGYYERGIRSVTIGELQATIDDEGLWIGLAELQNRDAAGEIVGVEHNAYQLVAEGSRRRIAVTTPLDAR